MTFCAHLGGTGRDERFGCWVFLRGAGVKLSFRKMPRNSSSFLARLDFFSCCAGIPLPSTKRDFLCSFGWYQQGWELWMLVFFWAGAKPSSGPAVPAGRRRGRALDCTAGSSGSSACPNTPCQRSGGPAWHLWSSPWSAFLCTMSSGDLPAVGLSRSRRGRRQN